MRGVASAWSRTRRAGLGVALVWAVAASSAGAAEPPTVGAGARSGPEIGARAYLDALAARDWARAAALYDRPSAQRLKDLLWPAIEREVNCGHDRFFHEVLGPRASFTEMMVDDPIPFVASLFNQLMSRAAAAGLLIEPGEIIGTVPEGDRLRHVVVRTRVGTPTFSVERMVVLSFERTDGGWGLRVGSELESYAYRLREGFRPECKTP